MASRAEEIRAFQDELLIPGAPPHHLAGWGSAASQRVRFAALLRAVDYRGGSVVDFGCGPGSLYPVLRALPYESIYVGLDADARVLDLARTAQPGARFELIELDQVDFEPVDYVFASGVFQFRDPARPRYFEQLVAALFRRCRVGLAVNFLSARRDPADMHPAELYLDPTEAVALAAALSPLWRLDHSYHPQRGDLTLGIIRRPAG